MAQFDDRLFSSMALFDVLNQSLRELAVKDRFLLEHHRKAPLTHKLAQRMESLFFEKYPDQCSKLFFDVSINGADIILHDREEKTVMSILVLCDYITRRETEILKNLNEKNHLALGVAFLASKPYCLIYQMQTHVVDYYHFNYQEMDSVHRMSKERDSRNRDQLMLLKKSRRRKKK